MLDSISRVSQGSIDWSHTTSNVKPHNEQDVKILGSREKTAETTSNDYTLDKLNKEIEQLNNQLSSLNHSLRMKFSEEAEQFYVEVIDVNTKEVIDSIPGKHMIDLAAKLKDMIGFFIDEKR